MYRNIGNIGNRNIGTSYFQNHLRNAAEEYKAILKYKTKTSCMSKNSGKVSNENK